MNSDKLMPGLWGLALALGLSTVAMASDSGVVKGFHAPVRPSANITKIKSTVNNQGNPDTTLSLYGETIDTESVNCPKAQGCTLIMHVMDEIGNAQSSGGIFSILVEVDGNYVDDGPTQGSEPEGGFLTGNWQDYYPVPAGNHTVTVQTFVTVAATQAEWTDTISVGIGQ